MSMRDTRETVETKPNDGIDLAYLIGVVRMGLWRILAITVICVVGTYFYVNRIPPTYVGYAQVILDTRQERVTNSEQVVSNLNVSNAVVAGEIVALRSNLLIEKVVDRLSLMSHPNYGGAIDAAIAASAGDDADAPPVVTDSASIPQQEIAEEKKRMNIVYMIQRQLEVQQIGISYAIGISVTSQDPVAAAGIANAIAEQYIEDQIEAKRNATVRATGWLEERIDELSQQANEADLAVVEFKTSLMAEIGGDETAIEQLLGELNRELVSTSAERLDADARFQIVDQMYASNGLEGVKNIVSSPLLATLAQQRVELTGQKAELSQTLGRRHPEMISLNAKIDELNRSIETELEKSIEAMRSDASVAANREKALLAQIADVERKLAQHSRASVRLGQLERSADATRLVYENFLSRFKETSAQSEYQRPDARLIRRADIPQGPAAPKKTLMMAASLVFGVSLGLATVFVQAVLSKSIKSSGELRAATGRPVMASLPFVKGMKGKRNALANPLRTDEMNQFVEGMRSLRARLFDTNKLTRSRVVMVTSALPSEGKSTVSMTLANVLGKVSTSTVIVDADLRRSKIKTSSALQDKSKCLVEYLSGNGDRENLVHALPEHGVKVVAPLRHTNNAADLIASERFGQLIQYLSSCYDVVIIDAPPVLNLPDTVVLANHADATLMVVRNNYTPVPMIQAAKDRLEESGAVVVGTVLTQVKSGETVDYADYAYSYS